MNTSNYEFVLRIVFIIVVTVVTTFFLLAFFNVNNDGSPYPDEFNYLNCSSDSHEKIEIIGIDSKRVIFKTFFEGVDVSLSGPAQFNLNGEIKITPDKLISPKMNINEVYSARDFSVVLSKVLPVLGGITASYIISYHGVKKTGSIKCKNF